MGLGTHILQPLIREHKYKPIIGDVLTIGRQTVYFTPEEILHFVSDYGVQIASAGLNDIEIDSDTIDRLSGYENKTLVTDRGLFRLLEVSSIRALDRSDYEGAEIIHDLAKPLPIELHGIADFIIDGSTLDNTFNPTLTLQNYNELLRPGGRLLCLNTFSSYSTPYAIMPPLWYLDYFVINGFVDCKAYVLVFNNDGGLVTGWNSFWLDIHWLQRERRRMGRFVSNYQMHTVIFAEKGENSTSDRYPTQQDYRSEEEWEVFSANLAVMQKSARPHLLRSSMPGFVPGVVGGHMLIDTEFNAISPDLQER